MFSRSLIGALLVIASLAGCVKNESKSRQSGASTDSTAGGGPEDMRIRAVIQTPWRDATAVNRTVRVEVLVNCPSGSKCSDDRVFTTNLLATKIRIRDVSGKATTVVPVRDETGGPVDINPFQYWRAFVPGQALEADKPYTVEATSDGDAMIAFADSSRTELMTQGSSSNAKPSTESIHIFTGSAPFATRIEAPNVKPVEYVRIRFSEPVALSSLVDGGVFLTDSAGNSLSGCPWEALSRTCAGRSSQTTSDLVDIMLSKPSDYSVVSDASLHLAGSVSGPGGRTLKEGLALAGVRASVILDGENRAHLLFSEKDWDSCSFDGSLSCIRSLVGH